MPAPQNEHNDDGIEIIVFSGDNSQWANFPDIHIWKDSRAMWVSYLSEETHVYERFLTPQEVTQIKAILDDVDFWEAPEQDSTMPFWANYSTIVARRSDQEISVVNRDYKYQQVIPAFKSVLENGSAKKEYFPDKAYLFTSRNEGNWEVGELLWQDKQFGYTLADATQGLYIYGDPLSFVWNANQNKQAVITSNGLAYFYKLKIPGLSCIYKYDDNKQRYECEIFTSP